MPSTTKQKFHLILDFDGTLVKGSTIPLLDGLRQDNHDVSYESFLEPYMDDYKKHNQAYRPSRADRKTLREEYEYLESLSSDERSSIERIEASGWLEGLRWSTKETSVFDDAAVQLCAENALDWRPGFVDLVQEISQLDGIIDILSVNWSGQFIRSLIRAEFGDKINIDRIRIYANEIDPSGTGRLGRIHSMQGEHVQIFWPGAEDTTFEHSRGIWTANDKARIMKSIVDASRADGRIIVYVGDSKTDLRCIMEADLGICIRDEQDPSEEQTGLAEILDRLGVKQLPINEISAKETTLVVVPTTVWYAEDFSAIQKALSMGADAYTSLER